MALSGSTLMLSLLLNRGDRVSVVGGKLEIVPVSGKQVPSTWLRENELELIRQIALLVRANVFRYQSYSTGNYSNSRYPGVNLQFYNIQAGQGCYTVFNAKLTRARDTDHGKKGTALPEGQFRVTKRYEFHSFWDRSGLKMPRRLSAFHDYMGKLVEVFFTGELDFAKPDRIISSSLRPFNISHEKILDAISSDKSRSITGQAADNCQTILPDKTLPEAQLWSGFQSIQTAGAFCHGNKFTRERGNTEQGNSVDKGVVKRPEDQTNEEWLAEYGSQGL
jgi:hypothetical protein